MSPTISIFSSGSGAAAERCIICSMRIPGVAGLRAVQRLRDQDIRRPLIVRYQPGEHFSSSGRTIKAIALDFIEKPFEDDVLLQDYAVRTCRS